MSPEKLQQLFPATGSSLQLEDARLKASFLVPLVPLTPPPPPPGILDALRPGLPSQDPHHLAWWVPPGPLTTTELFHNPLLLGFCTQSSEDLGKAILGQLTQPALTTNNPQMSVAP